MITRLRLKNWRSLRDVTIDDLQPINVFIGANASGKTNILDALYFIRDLMSEDIMYAVNQRGGGEKIRTLGVKENEPVEVEFSCKLPEHKLISWLTHVTFSSERFKFKAKQTLSENGILVFDDILELPSITERELSPFQRTDEVNSKSTRILLRTLNHYVRFRWQMLDENFMPSLGVETSKQTSVLLLDRCAENLVFLLGFMKETRPDLYDNLLNNIRYLLDHVNSIQIEGDEYEARLVVHESIHPNTAIPTVSSGTSRIFAMLTAYFALDMSVPAESGLVVIEEPDTALNPGLLKNFVEQLREYVDRPEPRQFILTTHNPAFLNYFRPEEVRIVARDEQGYTTVNRVPDYIKDIWLDEHGLGEVWLTNAFGGVAE